MLDFDRLYSWVRDLPIVDWHNHLDLDMIAADRPLGSLYEVWVKADPYKHRAMRICGESERVITGDASESEKWAAWTRTLPKLVGNPIFAWAKQEMDFLGIDGRENVSLADWTPNKLLKAFNVECLCPCVSSAAQLGQRASCPLPSEQTAPTLGQRASCPLRGAVTTDETSVVPVEASPHGSRATLGQRASCPLPWTAPEVREFPVAHASPSSHFSGKLSAGEFHKRNLPHVGQASTLVFVTFRLADSLPRPQVAELQSYKADWIRTHPEPWSDEVRREWESEAFARIDEWIDAGFGSCVLADPEIRKIVEQSLEYFNAPETGTTDVPSVDAGGGLTGTTDVPSVDAGGGSTGTTDVPSVGVCNGQDARCPSGSCGPGASRNPGSPVVQARYRLHAYVVMPNHVHVLLELFKAEDLPNIVGSWKSFTAKAINKRLGTKGTVWKEEYFDRLIRNAEHYENTLRYIRKNGNAAQALGARKSSSGITDVSNGQDARCPSASCGFGGNGSTGTTDVPSVGAAGGNTGTTDVPSVGTVNGQDARCPSDDLGMGPDSCFKVVPSLRMDAGDEVSLDTLSRFDAAGCKVVDISVDDASQMADNRQSLAAVAAFAAEHGWTMLLHLGALRETSARLRAAAGPAGGYAGMRAPVDPAAVASFLDFLETGTTDVPSVDAGGGLTGTTDVPSVDAGGGLTGTTDVPSVGVCNGQDARCPSASCVDVVNGQDARCPSGSSVDAVNGQDARCPSASCVDAVNGQDARCPSASCVDAVNGQDARCPSASCALGGGRLPRTILLSLNPEAHAQLAVLAGSFNGEGVPGKVQLGPAWWWCDHEEGIRDVLEKNAAYGVLSTFVGMTTDSRSLLSFVRHDYYRRIVCKWVAEKIAARTFPDDEALIRPLLENICYRNAKAMVS